MLDARRRTLSFTGPRSSVSVGLMSSPFALSFSGTVPFRRQTPDSEPSVNSVEKGHRRPTATNGSVNSSPF
ncbi:hypothetical protein NHX12_017071 [Muraenolepis orangiensis]|uniref:Uncharacterized protein n=1 Tax=Muraenolepis orangiensis TaxID=630683 RepID=A0A9Q0I1T5_9TELE|nr:hypothetical protein NHX12_017071 [Muraenolepis orangiensis]